MFKTAECVSPAHPDKLCDQISDSILDECLRQDENSRVAVETCGWHWKVFITWEISTNADVDYVSLAKKVLKENRYNPEDYIYDINISEQSNNIANWVDTWWAWDQWIMVWYASRETENFIPFELAEARKILRDLWENFPEKTRDSKSQVTTKNWEITTIVVSAERLSNEEILGYLKPIYGDITYHINPAWLWDNGGFESDAGLTWRKLAVDNYGPQIEIWWWAFSWKDYTKVDRSWAYMARNIAVKTLREDENISWAKVKIAYSIGVASPVMVTIETDKWEIPYSGADLTPKYIQEALDLKKPKYFETSRWGHFGNWFNWD